MLAMRNLIFPPWNRATLYPERAFYNPALDLPSPGPNENGQSKLCRTEGRQRAANRPS